MIDSLTILAPDIADQQSRHLIAPNAGNIPVYSVFGPGCLWNLKTDKGDCGDRFTFNPKSVPGDGSMVIADITESDTAPPPAYKAFVPGVAWCPRWLPADTYVAPLLSPSSYQRYSDCTKFILQDLGGPCETSLMPPISYNLGGDLGIRPACIHSYKYNKGYSAMEVNVYAPAFILDGSIVPAAGRAEWQLWALKGGVYQQHKVVTYNKWAPGGAPALNFPCKI